MQAAQLIRWQEYPALTEVPVPVAGPDDVVIKVGGAGVCQTDIHVVHDAYGQSQRYRLPLTLGHEAAGWVHEVGSAVRGFQVGDPVVVYSAWGCGRCANCETGAENYCLTPSEGHGVVGLSRDGGLAEFLLVPGAERHLVHLPENLSPEVAAPLADAALTPWHAINSSPRTLDSECTAVVLGAGGLGQFAVQLLKATSAAKIVVVDIDQAALDRALANGADRALLAEDAMQEPGGVAGATGAALVLDFVGTPQTMALAAKVAGDAADIVLVAAAVAGRGTFAHGGYQLPDGTAARTIFLGTIPELKEVLELAGQGRIKPEIVTYPLTDAAAAFDDLASGRIQGRRAVIVPHTLQPQSNDLPDRVRVP